MARAATPASRQLRLDPITFEVLRNAFNHLTGRSALTEVSPLGLAIMGVTIVVNLVVVRYESAAAERLGSEHRRPLRRRSRGGTRPCGQHRPC